MLKIQNQNSYIQPTAGRPSATKVTAPQGITDGLKCPLCNREVDDHTSITIPGRISPTYRTIGFSEALSAIDCSNS